MPRPKIPEGEKRKRRDVTLSDFEVSELRAISPRGELSDGIRIALLEANYVQTKRMLELEARGNSVRKIRN